MSSEILISQELLDSVLSDISIDEQLDFSMNKVLNAIDLVLQSKPSKELILVKREIKGTIGKIKNATSEDEKYKILNLFQKIYGNIIIIESSNNLYKVVSQARNLLQLWAHDLHSDKRGDYRIPVSIETTANCVHDSVEIYIINISMTGACLFASKELFVGDDYYMCIKTANPSTIVLQPRRVEKIRSSGRYVQLAGCRFKEPLTAEDLRSIIVYSYTVSDNK